MNGTMVTAVSGLAASAAWLQRIASNVVAEGAAPSVAPTSAAATNLPAIITKPLTVSMPDDDFATDFVDQSLALASYRASAALFKTAEEMNKVTLDLVA